MFVDNINPVLLQLGPFGIRYYGLVYAIGFLTTYFVLKNAIKKGRLRLKEEQLDVFFIWLVAGVIVGARVFEVLFFSFNYYYANPPAIFMIWNGGLSFHGGLVGAVVVSLIFCRKYRVQFYDLADLTVIPLSFFLFLGRVANFTNSEIYGKIANPNSTPWCVVFAKVDSYCRHPAQLYEGLSNLFTMFVLISYRAWEKKRRKERKERVKGRVFWLFVFLYGLLRFFIDFYREDVLYFGLSMGQWLSLIMVIAGTAFLLRLRKNSKINK